jgi:hypothetical protein
MNNNIIINMFVDNSFIPLNKNSFLDELKRLGIPYATIEKINWKNCIHEGYCVYNDPKKQKLCLTKIQNKNEKLCSIHRKRKYVNEMEEIDDMLKNMEIDEIDNTYNLDNLTETVCDTEIETITDLDSTYKKNNFINLNEKSIDSLFNNTNILLDNIDKYKKNKIDIEGLYKTILNYNKEIYKSDDEPYISISYLLQFFEELYEISNDFLYSIINNYESFDMFLDLCQRWKLRINEITKEIVLMPNYYQEYYSIMNKKIDDNLFNVLK